jgi:hypothetical protein
MGDTSNKKHGTTIRTRLTHHFKGTGNKDINVYLSGIQRNNLYVRWAKVTWPATTEANILQTNKPEWNKRLENASKLKKEVEAEQNQNGYPEALE